MRKISAARLVLKLTTYSMAVRFTCRKDLIPNSTSQVQSVDIVTHQTHSAWILIKSYSDQFHRITQTTEFCCLFALSIQNASLPVYFTYSVIGQLS